MYILKRILKSASKRVYSIFDSFFWEIYKRSCDGLQRIGESNSQCVIICNGPSLSSVDMDHISEIDTFAMNRSYLAYDDWGFVPTYYVCVNELVLDQFSNDIDILDTQKIINFTKRSKFKSTNCKFIKLAFKDRVIENFGEHVSTSATVTFVSIQLALLMGYRRIYIVGLDHSFSGKGRPNETLMSGDHDENHFLKDYFSGGIKWEYPDLERNENGYKLLRRYAEEKGVKIYDCTKGGKSKAFTKARLEDVL
jgi:hypothetical protein